MDFLNPTILAGAGLAAVPVVLHLIMRQQPRLLEFPALRFLQARQQSNRRSMRLRHWLLLALRVAAICFLALALARPSINASGVIGDQEAPTAAALVFDIAPRMSYRHENKTRLEAAEETALWLLPRLPADSQVAVVDASPGEPTFQIDMSTARQRIARMETTGLGRPLPELVESAVALLKKSELQRKEIYVFTDLAATAWSTDTPDRLTRTLAELPGLALYVIDVGVLEPRDLFLGELQLSSQVLARNSPLHVVSELDSLNMSGDAVVEMYLADNEGQMQKRGEQNVNYTPGSTQALDFAAPGLDVGTHQGYVRIVGEDSLPIDNQRFFTVEVKPPWRVLVAAAPPADYHAANFVEALAPADFRRSGHARFECEIVDFAELGRRPLESFAAVCLLDPPPLVESTWRQLSDYARAGHGVGIFLGPNVEQQFASFNTEAAQELLPGPLDFVARFPEGTNYLSTKNDQHPILAKFRPRRGSVPWEEFPVYRFWQFQRLQEGVATVMSMAGGQPALLEKPIGKGHALTLVTPASELAEISEDNRWNQLWGAGAWPFFTLTNELMLYLVGGNDEQLNYLAGQTAVVPVDQEKRFPTFLVTTPDGESIRQAPNQQNTVVVAATQLPGNYRVRAGGDKDGVNQGFSVNLAPEASQLKRIDEAELKRLFGEQTFHVARSHEQIDRHVSLDRVGRELFPLLIAVVAIVLGVEQVLSNRFYREAQAVKE
ncbi:MAG TPA: BatA domain-containing protein [Pirellulales bacterium]|nr:BatA domain-containing protein [Pirellulales bacterium]